MMRESDPTVTLPVMFYQGTRHGVLIRVHPHRREQWMSRAAVQGDFTHDHRGTVVSMTLPAFEARRMGFTNLPEEHRYQMETK